MKFAYIHTFFLWLFVGLVCSCGKASVEEVDIRPEVPTEGIVFSIQHSGEQKTRATLPDDGLKELTAIFFKKDVGVYKFHSHQTVSTYVDLDAGVYTYVLRYPEGGSASDTWAIAFVGNVASYTSPAVDTPMQTVLEELLTATGNPNVLFKDNNSYKIPMYALREDITLNYVGVQQLNDHNDMIYLTRTVAKFKIESNLDLSNALRIVGVTLKKVSNKGSIYFTGPSYNPTMEVPTTAVKSDLVLSIDPPEAVGSKVPQTIVFYAFETKNLRTNAGEYVDVYNAFETDKGNGYTYIELEDETTKKSYALSIPEVDDYPNFVVRRDYVGDIIRNRYYQFTINGITQTKFIDAYVRVTKWTDRELDVDL